MNKTAFSNKVVILGAAFLSFSSTFVITIQLPVSAQLRTSYIPKVVYKAQDNLQHISKKQENFFDWFLRRLNEMPEHFNGVSSSKEEFLKAVKEGSVETITKIVEEVCQEEGREQDKPNCQTVLKELKRLDKLELKSLSNLKNSEESRKNSNVYILKNYVESFSTLKEISPLDIELWHAARNNNDFSEQIIKDTEKVCAARRDHLKTNDLYTELVDYVQSLINSEEFNKDQIYQIYKHYKVIINMTKPNNKNICSTVF